MVLMDQIEDYDDDFTDAPVCTLGAEARLKAISEEQDAILRTVPELRDGAGPARGGGRRPMSAAERKRSAGA
jgi:hypothetical protein